MMTGQTYFQLEVSNARSQGSLLPDLLLSTKDGQFVDKRKSTDVISGQESEFESKGCNVYK